MMLWVLYDIEQDKARNRVAKYCKQAGLYRVQYSVFLGRLSADQRDTLELKIEAEINADADKVYLFPMSKDELKNTTLMGQAFDRKMVSDEVLALFF
jgi:CRISPR-associated protein Cas2